MRFRRHEATLHIVALMPSFQGQVGQLSELHTPSSTVLAIPRDYRWTFLNPRAVPRVRADKCNLYQPFAKMFLLAIFSLALELDPGRTKIFPGFDAIYPRRSMTGCERMKGHSLTHALVELCGRGVHCTVHFIAREVKMSHAGDINGIELSDSYQCMPNTLYKVTVIRKCVA